MISDLIIIRLRYGKDRNNAFVNFLFIVYLFRFFIYCFKGFYLINFYDYFSILI